MYPVIYDFGKINILGFQFHLAIYSFGLMLVVAFYTCYYLLENDLKNTVSTIEKMSDVELLAIGIGHDVKRYYKKAVKIVDVQDLGDTMINELSDLFSEKKTIH